MMRRSMVLGLVVLGISLGLSLCITANLISWLDDLYHGGSSPGGNDLTQRTW